MTKILLITEKPNDQAAALTHAELFDINKNSFSQFFARALLGSESDCRMYFNENYFLWMHAKGSLCHGNRENDGKGAIRKQIKSGEYSLIVLFGGDAAKTFLSNSQVKLKNTSEIMQNGPVLLAELPGAYVNDLCEINATVAILPHVSGRGQQYWMQYADTFSRCLVSVQEGVFRIIEAEINRQCTLYHPDGSKEEGEWRNGEFVK